MSESGRDGPSEHLSKQAINDAEVSSGSLSSFASREFHNLTPFSPFSQRNCDGGELWVPDCCRVSR